MKSKWMAIFWAIIMIAAGVLFLLRETGVIQFDQLPIISVCSFSWYSAISSSSPIFWRACKNGVGFSRLLSWRPWHCFWF